ncbi:MAG TPA: hypothetical protein VEP49_13505, partial [Acidimicrobiia bacterium]|nr:hypothetical protein [Acidimicrobiia bacterium]
TLGVQPREGSSFEGAVLDYLRTKHLLLVLDNCEHLLEPAGELTDRILRRCPDVRILATSREGLAVDGESVRPLRSLSLPLRGADADSALESAAVRLFADRAFAATSDFVMDASTTTTVAELCRRLDGVPLAIELAAARVAAMSPADIEARLDERFRLLTGGRRTAVERHQTLRATVDWSYSLLQETEQLVFARLGCFAGSFDVDAAQAVASGSGVEEWDVLDAVTSLVTKSMVVAERSADGIRYSMLETLRQYAREQLDGAGETDTWRRRHAEHYAHVAEELSDRLYGPAEIEARTHLRAELDNLRAAVDWALDARDVGDVALALRVIAALAPESAQDMTLGVAMWAVRAAEQAEHAPAVIRGPVLGAAAFQATFLGANDRAIELAREAVRDPIPPPCVGVSIPYVAWGLALTMRGDPHEAIDVLRDAHVQLAAGGFGPFVLCAVSATLANMAVPAGDLDLAREAAERALREARDSGSPQAHVNALFSYAAAIETDDPKEALAAFDECIAIVRAGAADVNFSTSMAAAGLLRVRAGDPTGWRGLDEAVRHAAERGYRPMVVGALDRVTRAVATTDRHEDTAVLSGITLAGPLGAINHFSVTPPNLTDARAALGEVAFERGAARGVAMEFDDAVAYSLALLAQVIHEAEVAS